ncbi:MAG TPA: VCBS repeat-containing protein [Oligoflexia bacterium]|nr:VCBS repeat-containing protein [Oligoflexia bacterium]
MNIFRFESKFLNLARSGWVVFLAVLLLVSTNINAQPVLGDYDGDGSSDMSVGLVDRSRNYTAYLTRLSSGAPPLFWEWGIAADAYAPGKYFGDGKAYPAIVHVVSASLPLHWFFKRPDRSDQFILYGLPGDTVPNHGHDFDGDGISDIYVVRDGTPSRFPGFRIWYIALSSTGGILETVFGMAGDRVYAADMNGDGRAEMVALRPTTYQWFSKNVSSDAITTVQWGLPGDIPLVPQDMNNDGQSDYIISRREGAGQVAYIRYGQNNSATIPLGQTTSIPLVGRFKGANNFAWHQRDTGWAAIRSANGSLEFLQHGISTNAVIRPDGSVIQPNEDGRFPAASSGGGGGTPPPSGSCTRPNFPDGRGGALWKPDREGGFARGGEATFLIPARNGSLSNSAILLDSGGNTVHNMVLRYHYGNGNRTVWDATVSNSQLATRAPLTMRVTFSNGSCEDRSIPNPHSRYD